MAEGRDVDMTLNYYDILGVPTTASLKAITKAYRVKALQLHPDKQTNPTVASVKAFTDVQVAYELLSDPEGRKALDAVLGAQVRAAARKAQLNSHRAALQEDLERRERAALNQADLKRAQNVLRAQIDRIRAENLARMQREVPKPISLPDEAEEHEPDVKRARQAMLKPYSQQYATLGEFEKLAFAQLGATK